MRNVNLFMMCAGVGCVCLSAQAQDQAQGTVFLDGNGDGVRQTWERGLSGVAVSDGVNITLTDASGRWELPLTGDDHYFVIKPRGYRTPTNDLGIPLFSYIHKPDGSPDDGFIWPGVEPTGPLPDSIDFPLVPNAEPDSFSIMVMADPQPYSEHEVDYYRADVIDPILGRHKIAFGVTLGDIVGDRLDLFEPLNQAQALFGVPWYNVYGNHDMNFMAGSTPETAGDPDRWADETFERVYGPTDYAFQYGRVHFVTLDNVIHEGFEGFRNGEHAEWPGGKWPKSATYRGGLRQEKLRFIENYLELVPEDELVVLLMHIPLAVDDDSIHQTPERRELLKILSSHPHTLSMSGHTHTQRHWFFDDSDGYAPEGANQHSDRLGKAVHHHINSGTASGSWYRGLFDEQLIPHTQMRCGTPNGYTVVNFDGNTYTSDYLPARRSPDFRAVVNIGEPGTTEVRSGDTCVRVVANVFNGAEGDTALWRIVPSQESGVRTLPWSEMLFAPQIDPIYQAIHDREEELAKYTEGHRELPDPAVCHHIWETNLPAGLPAGTHRLEIRHTDMYGRESLTTTTFRVVAD